MNMPCTNCGETLPVDAHRCPTCDALAPLPGDPTHLDETHVEEGQPAETQAVPWAIPIREGSVRTPGQDRLRPVVYGVLAVALVFGVLALGSSVLGGDDTEAASDLGPEVAGETADADADVDADDTTTTSTSTSTTAAADETTTTSSTSTSTTAPSSTVAPTTTTSPTAAGRAPGSAPQLSSSFRGGWVAQLTSVPTSAGPDAAERAWSEARAYASGAVVANSDDWSSLQPGFWVVVDDGPFDSADEVQAFCASLEHASGSDCMPRELTGRR